MTPLPIPAGVADSSDDKAARDWLDALADGTCTQPNFLRVVRALIRVNPDVGWQLLSLLDQYYRRGKIASDLFRTVKSQLEATLLNPAGSRDEIESARSVNATGKGPIASHPVTTVAGAGAKIPELPVLAAVAAVSHFVAATASPQPGVVLRGRYRLETVLSRGSSGTVYRASDLYRNDSSTADQFVAVRVGDGDMTRTPEVLSDFRLRFQVLQGLSHPHIIRVHEFERDSAAAFYTMEFLRGASVLQILTDAPGTSLARPCALAIARDVAGALVYAHARGVTHGALNLGRVFITDEGEVRVLNFQAAHRVKADDVDGGRANAGDKYASCQVLEGDTPNERDDMYSLAALTYVLLCGRHPFGGLTAIEARAARMKPARPSGMSGREWQALRAGLRHEREKRPESVEAWLSRFDLKAGPRRLPAIPKLSVAQPRKRRPLQIAALAGLVIAAALIAWIALHEGDGLANIASSRLESSLAIAERKLGQLFPRVQYQEPSRQEPSSAASSTGAAPGTATPPAPVPVSTPVSTPVAASVSTPAAPPAASTPLAPATQLASATRSSPTPSPPAPSPSATRAPVPVLVASSSAAPPPHSRIEMKSDLLELDSAGTQAQVTVRRIGSWRGGVDFKWWTESGTAKPGRDFVAVREHRDQIANAKGSAALTISLLPVARRAEPVSFYVVIAPLDEDAPGVGPRTVTMVTLPASE